MLPRVDELFAKTKATVEATLTKLGLDASKALVKESDTQATYTLKRGSAAVLVTVVHRTEQKATFLRVASPVLEPAEGKREALYQRLLEMNAGGLANASFGLLNDKVVVVSERPAENLDPGEVEQIVRHLSAVADTYDDRLVKEFGGKRASDK
jgi:type III secretion system-like peptide-binding chaperone